MTKAVIIRTTHGTARSVRSRRYYVVRSMPSWVYVNYKGENVTMPAGVARCTPRPTASTRP